MNNIIILFLAHSATDIYSTYGKMMSILKNKKIIFYLYSPNDDTKFKILDILKNKDVVVDAKYFITDIESIKHIDITHIFYKVCYQCLFPTQVHHVNMKAMFKNVKICFYNYGYSMVDHKYLNNVGYNADFFDNCDYFFIENKLNEEHYKKNIANKKITFFPVGCVKLDETQNIKRQVSDDNFYIMWGPRWHTSYNMCTYDLYVDYFIKLVNDNPKIILIFRPHPLTEYSIEKMVNASNERIIIDKIDDYNEHFKYINVYISDPSSMIPEAFSFSIPIIYTKKINNVFTEFGNLIEESFYTVNNIEELSNSITELVKGNDIKKSLRQIYIEQFFSIYNNTCEKIVSLLL